jgi:NADPH-dependent 2,4-dienoyl-CoA reductase/sulfur reductase-like enzyme
MTADANVIIGGGQAAARAAQSMRQCGFEGPITLFSEEVHLPYERPPLTKEYFLQGAEAGFKPILSRDFYEEKGIELRVGMRIESIEHAAHRIVAHDGAVIPYGRLLLATGGRLRRLGLEGQDKPNVYYVRTVDDSAALARRLAPGGRVLIVGGGFIGLEIAAAAQQRGCKVYVVEASPQILGRVAPAVVASYVAECHALHGIEIRTGLYPVALLGDETVSAVALSDGETLDIDAMVVGIGVIPRTELAEQAGLAIDNGILVDEFCATSHPSIFAAGDVANQYNPIVKCRLRQESWQNAQDQGVIAGSAMAGQPKENSSIPWAWSTQFDLNLQVAGIRLPNDDVIVRGDPASGCFTAFSLADGYIRGAVTVNRARELTLINRLLLLGEPVDVAALADETVSLREILQAATSAGALQL